MDINLFLREPLGLNLPVTSEHPNQFGIFRMAGHIGGDLPPYGMTEQVKVSQHVQDFMPDKFIREPEVRVDNLFIIYQDKVAEATSAGKPLFFKGLNIF